MIDRPDRCRTCVGLGGLVGTCLGLMSGVCPTHAGGASHEIGWHWTANSPSVYRFTRYAEERTPAPGKDPVFITEVRQRVSHDVVPNAGSGEGDRVRLTWDGLMYADRPHATRPVVFDSDTSDTVPNAGVALVAASVGNSVTCVFGPGGDVIGIEGHEAYLRGMEMNLSRWGVGGDRTYEGLKRMFTPDVVEAGTEPMYAFTPRGEAGVGDTHEVVRLLTLPKVGLVRTKETHTLDRITTDESGRRIAVFSVAGIVEWPEPDGALAERFNVSIDPSEITGWWTYDLGLGLPLVGKTEITFTADVVHYDPRDRSSAEFETIQRVVDTLDWLGDGETLADEIVAPLPENLGRAKQSP